MEEWMQYAKDMAKAEKELKIEQWVIISFYRVTERGEKVPLFKYDLPRRVADKYDWVILWRKAKLTCRYPRGKVTYTYYLYDRHSGKTIHSVPAYLHWRPPKRRLQKWNGP